MKPLTIITNYYNQAEFLGELVRRWETFPSEALEHVRFVVIDDGSSRAAVDVVTPLHPSRADLQVYRILVDIPYNFPGTINLGATVATTPWLLHHDMDHVASGELLGQILSLARPENENLLYQFLLEFSDGRIARSSSARLITAEWFWRLGGMDEDFAGNYGFDDVHFLETAHRAAGLSIVNTDYGFQADPRGASPIHRDISRNEWLFQEKCRHGSNQPGQILRFSWKRVY